MSSRFPLSELHIRLRELAQSRVSGDAALFGEIESYCKDLSKSLTGAAISASSFKNFWPPRLVRAMKARKLICFFGAGLSLPSGLPTWTTLLTREFPLDGPFQADPDLEADPLTRAELSAHRLGSETLQSRLRASHAGDYKPTLSHLLTAALRLPTYITTNYDTLFEQAWTALYGSKIHVVLNEADLSRVSKSEESLLFKIHGSVDFEKEHLILTRSDYRRHYRDNEGFFTRIRDLLVANDTLFLGFSHRDPEVTRLVEEAIFRWEDGDRHRQAVALSSHPRTANGDADKAGSLNLYSLQFDMKSHVPEIFAARGIVALEPSRDGLSAADLRTASLSRALIDLCGVAETELGEADSLDQPLARYCRAISDALVTGLQALQSQAPEAHRCLDGKRDAAFLRDLLDQLGELASQGVYLLDSDGEIKATAIPVGLDNPERTNGRLGQRPYFRQARTFRTPFVSDAFVSKFNGHATVALCSPILHEARFAGLLFSACQIGSWRLPLTEAEVLHALGLTVLIVDSNGVCLLPSEPEVKPQISCHERARTEPANDRLNIGFPFARLLGLSRRDKLVSRIMENVIPLGQDDDVLTLAGDLKLYSVVTEVRPSRWKLAVSRAVALARD